MYAQTRKDFQFLSKLIKDTAIFVKVTFGLNYIALLSYWIIGQISFGDATWTWNPGYSNRSQLPDDYYAGKKLHLVDAIIAFLTVLLKIFVYGDLRQGGFGRNIE